MTRRMLPVLSCVLVISMVWIGGVEALTAEEKCVLAKQKAARNRAICAAKEQFREAKGLAADSAKCEDKFDKAIGTIDTKAAKQAAACRYIDQGEAVFDLNTLCMWEQKETDVGSGIDLGNPHDVENRYMWSESGTAPDGLAFTDFWRR